MVNPRIFDNGGKTFDRYTILIGRAIFGCSENPTHPQGIGQYCGEMEPERMRATYRKSCWLGKRVKFDDLPGEVQTYIDWLCEGNIYGTHN